MGKGEGMRRREGRRGGKGRLSEWQPLKTSSVDSGPTRRPKGRGGMPRAMLKHFGWCDLFGCE